MSWWGTRFRRHYDHSQSKIKVVDPDDGLLWRCSVCSVPIFSSSFVKIKDKGSGKVSYVHDQCANLPKELIDSDVHPSKPLFLKELGLGGSQRCSACGEACGTMVYSCPEPECLITLDVRCASTTPIKITHMSHPHRLMVVRSAQSSSFACGACGTTKHDPVRSTPDVIYMCNACGFWIHPFCATLPNAVVLHQHQHPLLLDYERKTETRRCGICENVIESLGAYYCYHCQYFVHIMCVVSHDFKPVLIREARLPDLIRLPIPNEHTSVIRFITTEGQFRSAEKLDEAHEHPLILQNQEDSLLRVCNACVQIISPPFYKCSSCPHFFLHDSCAYLPYAFGRHPAHPHDDHIFPLVTNTVGDSISHCNRCHRPCNGFTYSCGSDFHLDVLCTLMPALFTHDAHGRAHILYSTSYGNAVQQLRENQLQSCYCCGDKLREQEYFRCWTCHDFNLHTRCALFPNTVTHKFDVHPLKLMTNKQYPTQTMYCEICEQEIECSKTWYYGCRECDQSFHTGCFPFLDDLSLIRFGPSSTITVEFHDCPLVLTRGRTVCGYRCGLCKKIFNEHDKVAWECSDCNYRIHHQCARPNSPFH